MKVTYFLKNSFILFVCIFLLPLSAWGIQVHEDNDLYLSGERYLLGDVNENGTVTPADAQMVLQYYIGVWDSLPNLNAADYDVNGNITPKDAQLILQSYISGTEIWVDPVPDTETPPVPVYPEPPVDDDTPIELPDLP